MDALLDSSYFSKEFLTRLSALDRHQTWLFLCTLWPNLELTESNVHEEQYRCFLQYVSAELVPLRVDQADFAIHNFTGIGNLMQEIYKQRTQSRRQILDAVKRSYLNYSDDTVMRSIELALRLSLTINVQSADVTLGPTKSNVIPIQWEDEISLDQLVRAQFSPSQYAAESSKEYRIDPGFNAPFLAGISGIRIEWTDNLAEHLRYNRNRRAVKVYEHKICLIHHLESTDSIIPSDVLREAIDTLNLLFPFDGQDTRGFLRQHRKEFYKIAHYGRVRLLDLREYNY